MAYPPRNDDGSRSSRRRDAFVPGQSQVRFRTSLHNTVFDVLSDRGWAETDHESDWDFAWADREFIREHYDTMPWKDHQRINHFRNYYELTRYGGEGRRAGRSARK